MLKCCYECLLKPSPEVDMGMCCAVDDLPPSTAKDQPPQRHDGGLRQSYSEELKGQDDLQIG